MTENTADKLREAKALIEDPERWTQGVAARNAQGVGVSAYSPEAVKWSAEAAVDRYGDWEPLSVLSRAARHLYGSRFEFPVTGANDVLGHAAVMAMYDRAIELAETDS